MGAEDDDDDDDEDDDDDDDAPFEDEDNAVDNADADDNDADDLDVFATICVSTAGGCGYGGGGVDDLNTVTAAVCGEPSTSIGRSSSSD